MSGWTMWLTGLPASGKTTLARDLRARLSELGTQAVLLDSDELRQVLAPEPDYSREGRDRFYHTLVRLAGLLNHYDTNVIIAATAPKRAYREEARERLTRYVEVWVRCPLQVCQARDPKGLYAAATAGEISMLPGVGEPYEEPDRADVIIDSDRIPVDQAVAQLIESLRRLPPPDLLPQVTHSYVRPS